MPFPAPTTRFEITPGWRLDYVTNPNGLVLVVHTNGCDKAESWLYGSVWEAGVSVGKWVLDESVMAPDGYRLT